MRIIPSLVAACALFEALSSLALGDISAPYAARTNNLSFTNAQPLLFRLPGTPVAAAAASSPSISTNFFGTSDDNAWYPPDTMGAVGPNHIVIMVNNQVVIKDRGGSLISSNSLNSWWNSVGPFSNNATNFVFDPHIVYDPYSSRWIATAAAGVGAANAALLVGASSSSDPTGAWYLYNFGVDANRQNWADFPLIGFNKDKVAISWTYVLISNGADNGSAIAVFDKTNLYAGGQFTSGVNLSVINVFAASGYNFAPAVTYDTNQAAIFILQSANASVGKLALYSITGSAGSAALTLKGTPAGPAWNPGGQVNFGKQLGTSQQINFLDDRMVQPVYREGTLWCAHTILLPSGSPTHSLLQWWQINPTNANSIQRGYIEDTTAKTNYAYPSIAVNRFKDVFIGLSSFATNQYASASYAFRACNDATGTFQAPSLLKAGVSSYWRTDGGGRNRWGDFSATQVDPVNDIDLWTHQEYAAQYVGTLTNGSGRWATWWGSYIPILPGNDNFDSYFAITNAQGSTNGTTVRATRETGEPNHAGNANTPSVWYRWVVPTSGSTTISAIDTGLGFDTVVAVYTGTTVGGLTLVTNRHASGGTNVVFTATAGTTYQIAVAGFNGSCGDFTLNWNAPTAPVILSQPQGTNCVANFNENAIFLVSAIGNPNPWYQWRFKGTNSTDTTTNIANATNTSYTISNVQTNHAGDYSVVITNSAGSLTSSIATLFIHGNSSARLGPFGFTPGKFWLQVAGLTNRSYLIQTSTNLSSPTNWHNIYTNFVSYWYTNSGTTNDAQRFYRAITNN